MSRLEEFTQAKTADWAADVADRRVGPVVSIVGLLLLAPFLALVIFVYLFTRPITGPFITGAKLVLLDENGRPVKSYTIEGFGDESCVDFVTTTGESFSTSKHRMRVTYPSGRTHSF